jgi:3-isopropylmalate dehydrogenase
MKRIAVIPGDGIGPEVVCEAVRVLKHLGETRELQLKFVDFDWGADKFLKDGVTLPDGALEMLSEDFDAILAGAFGDPRVPSNKHAEDILLGMRRGLDLYINLRPVRLLDDRLTPLANRTTAEINFVVFRENTEGAYCGAGGFLKHGTADEIALQDEVNTRRGVERIIIAAFEYARAKGRKRVTMADKSNVQRFGGDLASALRWPTSQTCNALAAICGNASLKKLPRRILTLERTISTSMRWRCSWCSTRRSMR